MKNKNIIAKLKASGLKGRGGADFPTYLKWQAFLSAASDKKYIVANGSEGEPATLKDGYIVKNYPADLIAGLKLALAMAPAKSRAFIYLRHDYYKKYKKNLEKLIGDEPITVFREKGAYLSGEETTLCQEIENKIQRPRIKPPYPVQVGIHGRPTLINNIETFYYITQIAKGQYKKTRFYTILGKAPNKGVFELSLDYSLEKILKSTKNFPSFDYFLQVGGGASGEIILPKEIKRKATGSGSIVIYDREKTDPWTLMLGWINFFMQENCDKCTPCREGTYRLREMIRDQKIDKKSLEDLFFVLENTSFCAFGKMVVLPFRSAIKKLL